MIKKTGHKIRYKGVYRLYRNGILVKETPYNLLDAFGSTPAITVEELEIMTSEAVEARAALMIEAIAGKCSDFNVINNIIIPSADCIDEEDDFMIGQIIDFAGQGNWDTTKWMECAGQELAVADYPELYEVIGREWTYNESLPADRFNAPDLRGHLTIGFDEDSPVTPRDSYSDDFSLLKPSKIQNYGRIGNYGGKYQIIQKAWEMPQHAHAILANASGNDSSDYPAGTNYIAKGREVSGNLSYRLAGTNVTPTLGVSGAAGISFPHENRQPYRTVYKLIRFK